MNVPTRISAYTIIISTYNKPATLAVSLAHLAECKLPHDLDVQVVVVDNNSTDDTRSAIEGFIKKYPASAEYVFEGRQGNGFARNAGIARARGEIITNLDHDMVPDRNFVHQVRHEFERLGSRGIIGGRVDLWDQPHFLRTGAEEKIYGIKDHPAGFIHGGNLSFHRDVIARIGGFDVRFGAGTSLPASDTDFAYRAWRAGCEVRYSPNVVAYHNHGRITDEQIFTTLRSYWIANGAFFMKHVLRGDGTMLRRAYWDTLDSLRYLRDPAMPSWNRRRLWYYALGAFRYLRVARRPELSPSPAG